LDRRQQGSTRDPCAGIICIAIGTGFLACAAVFILVFRNVLGYLFVDSADVAAAVASICPIAALYQIPDGVLGTIGGVLRRVFGRPLSFCSDLQIMHEHMFLLES